MPAVQPLDQPADPSVLPCPECPEEIGVSAEDPDGSLSELWHHLGRHARTDAVRTAMFIQAQQDAR